MIQEYIVDDLWTEVKEPSEDFFSDTVNNVTYNIIGACFDVYNELGRGFSEIVYKDAIEYELKKRSIQFERERKFEIKYKETVLQHCYFADFVIEDQVILEVKAKQGILEDHYKQTINYLAASKITIGLLINFGESSLKYKRIILTK